jgi:hypothetical protein
VAEFGLGVAAGTVEGQIQVMAVPGPIDIGPAGTGHAPCLGAVAALYLG